MEEERGVEGKLYGNRRNKTVGKWLDWKEPKKAGDIASQPLSVVVFLLWCFRTSISECMKIPQHLARKAPNCVNQLFYTSPISCHEKF